MNAETPGAIHEGGELGYCLAVAYGSIMDKPNHITVAVIGDGESETGPTATAWHSHKYIDPKESGAVIPILHANGYKVCLLPVFSPSPECLSWSVPSYRSPSWIVRGTDKYRLASAPSPAPWTTSN